MDSKQIIIGIISLSCATGAQAYTTYDADYYDDENTLSVISQALKRYNVYAGMEVRNKFMSYEKNYGRRIIAKRHTSGNMFVGFKFNDYLGIEAGYEFGKKKKGTATVLKDDGTILGENIMSDSERHEISSKMSGLHIGLVAYSPIYLDSVQFFTSIGAMRTKLTLKHQAYETMAGMESLKIEEKLIGKKSYKYIPRINLGAYCNLIDYVDLRATIGWERTKSFGTFTDDIPNDAFTYQAKPKNSLSYSLGMVIRT